VRRAHWLRPTKSAQYPRDIVVFDTETVPKIIDSVTTEQQLAFGWAARIEWAHEKSWTEPNWFRFTESIDLWRWLDNQCRAKRAVYVYCHNANFDWQVTSMMRLLPELGWTADATILEDPPNYFRWTKDGRTLKLLDTFNYWRVSVAALGERLGLEKLPFPDDWSDPIVSDLYCRRDVEILLQALVKWIAWLKDHQLGGLGISLAQQAWKAYLYRFMDEPIYIDANEDALNLARDSYYGGRVECFRLNTQLHNVYCCDVNSMYPAIMHEHEFPTRLHGRYKRVSLDELSRWVNRYAVCARVLIQTDEPAYPERTKDGLMFPLGEFVTTLCTPELQYALAHNHIRETYEAAIYDKARLFTRFIDTMYELRLQFDALGDETAKYYTKIMMNSLYGKFGQRGIHEEIIGSCDPNELYVETEIDLVSGKRYRNRHIAGLILSRSIEGESRYSHPAIAAHVTAHARMMLYRLLWVADPVDTFYMDTDSLHVNRSGFDRLLPYIDSERLGALKLEKVINSAIYYGPKDYELDGMRVIKGIRKTATELSPGVFSQDQWVSIRGAMLTGHGGGPLIRRVERHLARQYSKGRVSSAGRVAPWYRHLFK
jgi:hypothetical protein